MRRMVEKSSTTRIFMFLSNAISTSLRAAPRPLNWSNAVPGQARHPASLERSRNTACPWIWHTRDSLTPSTAPISFRFNSCS